MISCHEQRKSLSHPIAQALRWQEWLEKEAGRKPADVARAFKVKTGNEIAQALGISLPSVQNIKKAAGLVGKTKPGRKKVEKK